jgi:pimeloyl-ACP methyl ester carboxylesterase
MLLDAVERHPNERPRIVLALQRQNVFVPADSLDRERRALIEAIAKWDESALVRYFTQYQVEDVLKTIGSPSIGVRLFELFAPVLAERRVNAMRRLDPDLEVGELFGAPLLKLLRDGMIRPPTMDLAALHRVRADVYMLAGRFDHTADYRSQIALAARYPNGRLLLLADDHNFLQLQKTGLYPALVQSALAQGVRGPRQDGLEDRLSALVYRE